MGDGYRAVVLVSMTSTVSVSILLVVAWDFQSKTGTTNLMTVVMTVVLGVNVASIVVNVVVGTSWMDVHVVCMYSVQNALAVYR
jgi:hypothetical protein